MHTVHLLLAALLGSATAVRVYPYPQSPKVHPLYSRRHTKAPGMYAQRVYLSLAQSKSLIASGFASSPPWPHARLSLAAQLNTHTLSNTHTLLRYTRLCFHSAALHITPTARPTGRIHVRAPTRHCHPTLPNRHPPSCGTLNSGPLSPGLAAASDRARDVLPCEAAAAAGVRCDPGVEHAGRPRTGPAAAGRLDRTDRSVGAAHPHARAKRMPSPHGRTRVSGAVTPTLVRTALTPWTLTPSLCRCSP